MSAADKAKHTAEDLVGKAKEGFGKLTDNERLESEGRADQVKANAKKAVDDAKDAGKKIADDVADGRDR